MASYLKKKPYVYKDCPGYIGVTLLYPYYVCGKRYHKVKRFRYRWTWTKRKGRYS